MLLNMPSLLNKQATEALNEGQRKNNILLIVGQYVFTQACTVASLKQYSD